MERQTRIKNHPVFELGGDLFMMAFPKDHMLSGYLCQRLNCLPEHLGLSVWRQMNDMEFWAECCKEDPALKQYRTGYEYLVGDTQTADLGRWITDPFLMQRITVGVNCMGCYLLSSASVHAVEQIDQYNERLKLLRVRDENDVPECRRAGTLTWNFRPCLIPLDKYGTDKDVVRFRLQNPNGTIITGGTFTLHGKDVRSIKDPLHMADMCEIQMEDGYDGEMIEWFTWNGCLIATETQWKAKPTVLLDYLGRPNG